MTYLKPEIVTLGDAARVIQGAKTNPDIFDSLDPTDPQQRKVVDAYELDE